MILIYKDPLRFVLLAIPDNVSSSSLWFEQMHNLLDLVQKEQDIYNICFHELIRQVRETLYHLMHSTSLIVSGECTVC